ncbi:MAG TPA: tRNA (N6-threonylcarbamoyladenosine(37)-N6)-methyltransferase TrmO [Polyangiaceae bacterium]
MTAEREPPDVGPGAELGVEVEDGTGAQAAAVLTCRPIGVVHSPFRERSAAPRQPSAAKEVRGRIELYAQRGFEHALSDIEAWPYLWVIFWFHLNRGWRPKVLPPRSARRRGLFATRAPHRPNPLGLSVVKLERVEGLVLHVSGLDILDGTPVLDIKPYVPYADAISEAEGGWLETALDPVQEFEVVFERDVEIALAYLRGVWAVDLEDSIRKTLALGPQQHAYRRIRRRGTGYVLAVKEWRARFRVEERRIVVEAIESGYRPRELAQNDDPALDAHRALASGKRA